MFQQNQEHFVSIAEIYGLIFLLVIYNIQTVYLTMFTHMPQRKTKVNKQINCRDQSTSTLFVYIQLELELVQNANAIPLPRLFY